MKERSWQGIWIRAEIPSDPEYGMPSAPLFRGIFSLERIPQNMRVYLSGIGWHELYVNGRKADDRVLAPVVMQYTKHIPYIEYDIKELVKSGENSVEVILGNGWYHPYAKDVWNFQCAPWNPPSWEATKLICDVAADEEIVLKSDFNWQYTETPICFNTLRNGETYDAGKEKKEKKWRNAVAATPPIGILKKENLEPCRVCETLKPCSVTQIRPGVSVFDFGRNIAGWGRIRVHGEKGAKVTLRYGERIAEDGSLDQSHISKFVLSGDFQTDRYILSGSETSEEWSPRFTYHGFRYIQAETEGVVDLESVSAEFIHNAFEQSGKIETDSEELNWLQKATVASYLANFTGIPTDCPHREKNGWTGDAHLAAATGLWNFNAEKAYIHFLEMVCDTQQNSGIIASIAPSGGWGINLNPPWDVILFELPELIFRFTDDVDAIRRCFPAMMRYWRLLDSMNYNNLITHGLGDWCSSVENTQKLKTLISSAYFYRITVLLSEFAKILNCQTNFFDSLPKRAEEIAESIRSEFHNPDGSWADDSITALGTVLYFGLSQNPEADAKVLAEKVRQNNHLAYFGIFGAKLYCSHLKVC